jgi:hypothetical protein
MPPSCLSTLLQSYDDVTNTQFPYHAESWCTDSCPGGALSQIVGTWLQKRWPKTEVYIRAFAPPRSGNIVSRVFSAESPPSMSDSDPLLPVLGPIHRQNGEKLTSLHLLVPKPQLTPHSSA